MKDRYILSDFAEPIAVAIQNAKESHLDRFVGLEHYDSGEPVISRYSDTSLLGSSVKEFHKNDILIARRNVYLKRAGICLFDGLTSGDSIVLRIYNDCEKRTGVPFDLAVKIIPFVVNSNSFWAYANKHADGMNSKRISKEKVLSYEFSLPSLAEQKVLADKLWAAYEVKQSYLNMIDATNQMVKAKFMEMLDSVSSEEFSIGEIAKVNTGSTPSRSVTEYWGGTNPWVSAQDMGKKYIYDTIEKVTDKGYATCKIIPAESVLYVCRGSIGVMSINKIDCATNQSICTATCGEKCRAEYLYYYLEQAKKNIKQLGVGTSFKSLNQSSFSALKIQVPNIDVQDAFITIAEQAESTIFALNQSIVAIDKVIRSLINENL